MITDSYALQTSSAAGAATAAFEEAVHGLGAHRPSTGAAVGRTLAADPNHVPAHVLKGFANLILAREELVPAAGAALKDARGALAAKDGGTADERVLVEALALAEAGRFAAAADRLDQGFADRPATFLPFKIANALRFMLGDAAGMLAASDRMLTAWRPDDPAAGFLLGCHAFGLEEHGLYDAAESFGRRAVALQPDDAWGLHAVSHVHEMRGDTAAGIAWLEEGRPNWTRCNNFSFHMAWHLALLRLEEGDHDGVLALYDEAVRPTPTDDFRDVANAVSLLWRLDRRGVDVGERWQDLADIALKRRTDSTLVFAALHTLIALVALGEDRAAADVVAALEAKAAGTGDQATVAREVGVPFARIILGMDAWGDRVSLDRLALALPRLGGSNAQRDLFVLALAEVACRCGDDTARLRIRAARRKLKAEDHLIAAIDRRAMETARHA
ncbi:tetratricopeptide repeat protein 38 family protein [Mongoliimonas terrestris]|uniref:tetratricopeptide repeat protein 38 family protein n=1 Tax=Mongoliimonas terrestris TaxID=1709001 RepID=UPI000949B007|nr:tetratricopeptide repeat protein 38 family protein [Mongoliimonas terrestris]